MLLLSMSVDRSRIRYRFGWSFHYVIEMVYRKEGSTINDSAIVTID
jgi:hypothetical protein